MHVPKVKLNVSKRKKPELKRCLRIIADMLLWICGASIGRTIADSALSSYYNVYAHRAMVYPIRAYYCLFFIVYCTLDGENIFAEWWPDSRSASSKPLHFECIGIYGKHVMRSSVISAKLKACQTTDKRCLTQSPQLRPCVFNFFFAHPHVLHVHTCTSLLLSSSCL